MSDIDLAAIEARDDPSLFNPWSKEDSQAAFRDRRVLLDALRAAEAREATLREVLHIYADVSCRCEPAWTRRGMHAPDCAWAYGEDARAALAEPLEAEQ